ncbi:MAG: hypothetical protein E7487_11265 [Ruminococcaceae bacterium]|nr:hypothetical protein [Oscillospiraceae bacterium]
MKNNSFIYKHVVVLGVDGAGNFFKDTETPNMDRIFADGAVNYNVLTAIPTISAECWGSMLLGVTPEVHCRTNGIVSSIPYDIDSPFPSLFRKIRETYPDAEMASFCCWNPINFGIVENNLGVYKDTAGDDELTDKICTYLEEHDPMMLFVQFDWVDGAGHHYGYGTKEHLDRITVTDALIGRIHDMYVKRGFIDDTLFIVTADHGGFGYCHGGVTDDEKIVFWGAAGKTVKAGTIGDMLIRDNAAVCLYALGVDQPETWTARVPDDLFVDFTDGERPIFTKLPVATAHRAVDAKNAPSTPVTTFFSTNSLAAYLPFENTDYTDASGNTAVTAHGKQYFPNGFLGTGYKFDDGCLTLDDFVPGTDSFSVSLWFKTNGIAADPSIFANNDRSAEKYTGFCFSIRQRAVRLSFGWGEESWGFDIPLPVDYTDGWIHIIVSVDRDKQEVSVYLDFKCAAHIKLPAALAGVSLTALPFTIGQDGTGAHPTQLSAVIDELVVTKEIITPSLAETLRAYYLTD